ncbi:MAG: 2-oxoacid:acceptor oxidoreductase family protein [Candidatus Woesearchaeota archaeon]
MIEIRVHGRGGQGAVSTGQIIAIAALYDGKHSQTFPKFGVERRGAPVETYVRIDNKPINIRSQVYNPDIVLVLDSTLIQTEDITKGVKDKGTFVINTSSEAGDLNLKPSKSSGIKSGGKGGKKEGYGIHTIDASSTAMKIFNRPIVNTPILGGFSAITGVVSIKSLQKAIDEKFVHTKGKQTADLNKKAVKEVYDTVKD